MKAKKKVWWVCGIEGLIADFITDDRHIAQLHANSCQWNYAKQVPFKGAKRPAKSK